MKNKRTISYASLKTLVDAYNQMFNENPKDEEIKEKRRALFNIRRNMKGAEPIDQDDFELLGMLITESETSTANQLKELGREDLAANNESLAKNNSLIVLEILEGN